MILVPLFGTALLVSVATGPLADAPTDRGLTSQQKNAATQPLVRSATECIVHAVTADPRFGTKPIDELGDLIVDSMHSCVGPVRAMIDAYDRCYGEGSGEAFFKGPYLDVLPKVVVEASKKAEP